ncbi:hypothetical protein [Streptomyces nigrescens]|uniref:Uncharacterized protein n=1 Tax=Streptomyces nigrescens TaxID=1920 RepID=A0ABY7JJ38_STRNI|nr:hypothetical protein [Streptomyces nigrescens]WAU06065.1 hypothetical protein STRNI_004519 [Streptomyces nigrescens]WAU09966.1 hypothetical protein STRNI_008252 [Streptomyces nigrescens]
MNATIITDHLGWGEAAAGEPVRLVEHNGAAWVALWADECLIMRPTGSGHMDAPPVAYTSPIRLPYDDEMQPLVDELMRLGTVQRLTNPSLWDAITTALLRQATPGERAHTTHRVYCATYGRTLDTFAGPLSLVPSPERVLTVSDGGFAAVGAATAREALRSAAEAYLVHAEQWQHTPPEALVQCLADVRGIDAAAAAVAVADFTSDYSIYPHGDLALRTCASRAAPALSLPSTDREFEALWRRWAPDPLALHTLTLFTLTWGNHARAHAHARSDR